MSQSMANQGTVMVPTVWEPMLESAAYQPRGLADRTWNVSDSCLGPGNKYRINVMPAAAVTPGFGSGHMQLWTTSLATPTWDPAAASQIELTFTMKAASVLIEPDLQDFSISDLGDFFTNALGELMYQGIEVDLFQNSTDFGVTVGSNAVNFTESDFLLAQATLLTHAKDKIVPGETEVFAAYDLAQWDNILSFGNIVSSAYRGDGVSTAVTGKLKTIYGTEFIMTGNVMTSGGGRQNLVFARKALAWGRKYNAKIETDRVDLRDRIWAYYNFATESVYTTAKTGAATDLAIRHITL